MDFRAIKDWMSIANVTGVSLLKQGPREFMRVLFLLCLSNVLPVQKCVCTLRVTVRILTH